MKDRLVDAAVNQGYTPHGAETNTAKQTDHKESYEHRRFNNDRCPTDSEMAGFKTFLDEFYAVRQPFLPTHHLISRLNLTPETTQPFLPRSLRPSSSP